MRRIIVLIFIISSISCSKKQEIRNEDNVTKTDSVQKVGSDEDGHGCETSAGYTWSQLRKQCVRVFETAILLRPIKPDTMAAFVIFDLENKNAEIFVVTEPSSIILSRQSATYQKSDWKLTSSTPGKYILSKGTEVLFESK